MSRLPSIQEQAPAFTQQALFPNKDITNLSLSDYLGKWVVFFWYPLDFTFVCPTEIIAFSDRAPEFEAINTQVIAASCDSHFTHLAWVNTPRGAGGLGDMKIPIVADFDKTVANAYGVLLPGGVPLRALFIISPVGQLRQITVNDLPVGRNVDEILRLVKAFQFTDTHGEVCPANWHPGDATMIADPEKSKEYFSATHGAAKSAEATTGTASIDSAAQFDSVTRGSGVSVIQYWAPWCRNCLKLAPGIQALATELAGASFYKLNTTEHEDVAANQQISALPTFQVFKNGALAGQYVGADLAKLKVEIQKSL